MTIIYKPIDGIEDYYVCNSGINRQTILSCKGKYGDRFKWMTPNGNGRINIEKKGKPLISFLFYRVLAEAFIPIPQKYKDIPKEELVVHHIDHNRNNNKLNNLMWLSDHDHRELHANSDITKDRLSDALKGENCYWYGKTGVNHSKYGKHMSDESRRKLSEERKGKVNKKLCKPVEQWSLDGTTLIARYESANEAARAINGSSSHIIEVCKGKLKHYKGYIWKYHKI